MRSLSDAPTDENSVGVSPSRNVVAGVTGGNKVALPDALTPFHLASQEERDRRVGVCLERALEVYGTGVSLAEAIHTASGRVLAVGEYAKIWLRRVLLELNLDAWEKHPARRRSDVRRTLKRAIGLLRPHDGGWRTSNGPRRKRNMTREELLEHIESRATPCPETGCWLWTGAVVNGYARMGLNGGGKTCTVTRFILGLEANDPREALHSCDCPPCVNPAHLRIGTHRQNMREMSAKGRAASGPTGTRRRGAYHPALWRRL